MIVIADTISLYPERLYAEGLELVTVATRRMSHAALDPRIKSLNYLNNILAKIEAQQAGAMEAVMLNAEGYVAECTADNIFAVGDGRIAHAFRVMRRPAGSHPRRGVRCYRRARPAR